MTRRTRLAIIAGLSAALVAQPAQAMIRHVFIFELAVSLDVFDVRYFRHHAPECVRFFGPWLRRYETYRAKQVPAEADRDYSKTGASMKTNGFLYRYYITKMQLPYGKLDSLTAQQYIDIVAFMLASNGYAAGSRELPADSAILKRTKITRQSAGGARGAAGHAPTFISSGEKASSAKPTQAELNAAYTNTTDWLLPNHDYAGQRFVDVKHINRRNAAALQPVAIYQVGDANAFHNNPIVYQGVMYIATTNSTMTLDATTLKLRWRVDRKPKGPEGWPMHRGVALKDGKVIRGTHDGYLLAFDAADCKLLWERALVDMRKREGGFTMAPLLYEDLILIGPAGSERGIKGWVGAFRLEDGEQVWRFNTTPDDGEPGAETWKDAEARTTGGGAVWAPFSLDVEEGVLYVPVSNPAPDFYTDARQGSNLYTNGRLSCARRAQWRSSLSLQCGRAAERRRYHLRDQWAAIRGRQFGQCERFMAGGARLGDGVAVCAA